MSSKNCCRVRWVFYDVEADTWRHSRWSYRAPTTFPFFFSLFQLAQSESISVAVPVTLSLIILTHDIIWRSSFRFRTHRSCSFIFARCAFRVTFDIVSRRDAGKNQYYTLMYSTKVYKLCCNVQLYLYQQEMQLVKVWRSIALQNINFYFNSAPIRRVNSALSQSCRC